MIFNRLSCFIKMVIGVLLLQVVTVLLVVAAMRSNLNETVALFVLVGGLVGFLAALWFASIYSGGHKLAVSQAREGFSREREKLRVKSEKEKARLMVNSEKRAAKTPRRSAGGGGSSFGLKGNTAMIAAVGVGGVLIFSQFVTLGLAALAAVGGSMAGYKLRSFQESGRSGMRMFGGGGKDDLKMLSAKQAARLAAADKAEVKEVKEVKQVGRDT